MKTLMLRLGVAGLLLATVATVSARPVHRSQYAPPSKPIPVYPAPPSKNHTQVPDAASTGLLIGIAAASLAAARRKWQS